MSVVASACSDTTTHGAGERAAATTVEASASPGPDSAAGNPTPAPTVATVPAEQSELTSPTAAPTPDAEVVEPQTLSPLASGYPTSLDLVDFFGERYGAPSSEPGGLPALVPDALSGLPVTTATDRFAVDLLYHEAALVVDLASASATVIAGWSIDDKHARSDTIPLAVFDAQTDERAYGWADWQGVVLSSFELDDGRIGRHLADGAISVFDFDTGSFEVVESDGSLRCSAQVPWDRTDHLRIGELEWRFATGETVDLADCSTDETLPAVSEATRYAQHVGTRFYQPRNGVLTAYEQVGGSWEQSGFVTIRELADVFELADRLWVTTFFGELFELDRDTLAIVARHDVGPCSAIWPFEHEGMVWIANDCDAQLRRIDPASGAMQRWALPDDGFSDRVFVMIGGTSDGLWLANFEQSAEPFHFSFACECFERLPDELRALYPRARGFSLRPRS